MMKIGIDYRPALKGTAGIGRYARELVRAMVPLLEEGDALILFNVALRRGRGGLDSGPRVKRVDRSFPNPLLRFTGVERFTNAMDLFHYTDFVYPRCRRTRTIVTLFDLLFLHEKGYHPAVVAKRLGCRVSSALSRAAGVIVPSDAVRLDVERFFPDLAAPVRVIPLGGDHLPEAKVEEIPPGPFFLTVGTFEPRKNRLRLLKAFEQVHARDQDLELVMVGGAGWLNSPFEKALESSPARSKVRLLFDVDDAMLRRLYETALALVYPSLGEGFGLPVAEAFYSGCPVITSNGSAAAEVAGQAAFLVDPLDTDDLYRAMSLLSQSKDRRAALAEAGRKRSGLFTWEKTAKATLDFYRETTGLQDRS